ncbi:MAG TPA: RusA family crossover junction endodeoxyribonuclease [Vicinamibacterales bacterium]|nr:RusA family crossover junction endodeoxyribonuclease [Vicinamibacterales bacterium]
MGRGKNAGKLAPSAPALPRGKPDIDKLARSTLDALSGIVFDDDARVASLELRKVYAAPGDEGATITVEGMCLVRDAAVA